MLFKGLQGTFHTVSGLVVFNRFLVGFKRMICCRGPRDSPRRAARETAGVGRSGASVPFLFNLIIELNGS